MTTYTKEERIFINHCFDTTLAHFAQNPLKRDKDEDILKAINHRNYRIGSIGIDNHRIMHLILDKLGYCKDGKTTKDEQLRKDLAIEKEKAAIWGKQQKIAIDEIDAKMKELQLLKSQILSHDKVFNRTVKEEAVIAQEKFKEEMHQKRIESQEDLIAKAEKTVDKMGTRELRLVAKEKGIKNYSRMNKETLLSKIKGD